MPIRTVHAIVAVRCALVLFVCIGASPSAIAQTQDPGAVVPSVPCHFTHNAPARPGPACLLARQEFSALPGEPVYWHIDAFVSQSAAQSARGANGTVVNDYGRIWLFTVAGKDWQARGGTHVATIGPLPVAKAAAFTAEYIHSLFSPGMSAPIHKHSGPEAFYALEGDTCLEMPGGAQIGTGPGNHLVMPAGEPMLLMAIGAIPRRAFALILHDSNQAATTRVSEWLPAGVCLSRLDPERT